jgi:hypothetical protein
MPSNKAESSIDDGEDNYSDSHVVRDDDPEEGEEVIKIAYLKKGYNWRNFITTSESENPVMVLPDYFPPQSSAKDCHVVARCKYLKIEPTQKNKAMIKGAIDTHQRKMMEKLKDWVQAFWIELCDPLEITHTDGKKVRSWEDLQDAVRQITDRNEAKKFVILFYLAFDFCRDFRKRLGLCLMKQFSIVLDMTRQSDDEAMDPNKNKPRATKDCFERLVTRVLAEQRKNINYLGTKTCGYSFTITRPGNIITEENENDTRSPCIFYTWMVMGRKVWFDFRETNCYSLLTFRLIPSQ